MSTLLAINHFKRLSTVEVQLCMQFLDTSSLLRLARCNKSLYGDADNSFSWKMNQEHLVLSNKKTAKCAVAAGCLARYHNFICTEASINGYSHRLLPIEQWQFVKMVTIKCYPYPLITALPILLEELPTLQKLRIIGHISDHTSISPILEPIVQLVNLSSLSICYSRLSANMGKEIGRVVALNNNIRTLRLVHCVLTDEHPALEKLLEALGDRHNLQIFELFGMQLTTSMEFETHLPKVLGSGTIEHVSICGSIMSMGAGDVIIKSVMRCQGLKKLDLAQNGLHWSNMGELNSALKQLPCLRTFDISHNFIEHGGLWQLADQIPQNHPLEELYLTFCYLDHWSASAIAMILQRCTRLKKLYLNRNKLEADGAMIIAPYIANHASLEILHIADNNLGQQGLVAIANAAKANVHIRLLDISKNKINAEKKVAIKVVATAAVIIRGLVTAIGHRCRVIS
jgi:hypothetical protein